MKNIFRIIGLGFVALLLANSCDFFNTDDKDIGLYKVGGKGPAGGLIFYDKGDSKDGWRYLEAASADIAGTFVATSEDINIDNCDKRAVGKGKSNTEAIMKEAAKKGGGFTWAAYKCVSYTQGGYDDWFLPSRDELHYMYGNLHMQELGDFKNEKYWSSTAVISYGKLNFWQEDFSNGNQDTSSPYLN